MYRNWFPRRAQGDIPHSGALRGAQKKSRDRETRSRLAQPFQRERVAAYICGTEGVGTSGAVRKMCRNFV